MNHVLYIVLDSCRLDSGRMAAQQVNLRSPQERHTYATWTAPSHLALLQGLPPYPVHQATTQAHEVYRASLNNWRRWFGATEQELPIPDLSPSLWVPSWLGRHGIASTFISAMPCIGPQTMFNRGWISHVAAPTRDFLYDSLEALEWRGGPRFQLVNSGETHYPYTRDGMALVPGEGWAPVDRPRLSGLNGVASGRESESGIIGLDYPEMARMHADQINACMAALTDVSVAVQAGLIPRETYIVVTSDHGELFGEEGMFGHGPYVHPNLFAVPWWEGKAESFVLPGEP